MRARHLWCVVLLILLGAGAWWIVHRDPPAGITHGDALAVDTARDRDATASAVRSPDDAPEAAVARREVAGGGQTVLVEVVDGAGAAVAADFLFAEFPGRDAPFVDLSPQREVLSRREWEAAGVRKAHADDGRLRIDSVVPSGIAVHVRGLGSAACFLQVPPRLGISKRRVVLDDRKCHLSVFVWDSDLRRGAADVTIECVDEKDAVCASGSTDANGAVAFDVEPAGYLVRVAGADPADADSRRVVGLARQRGAARTVVLAVPERRFEVKVEVEVYGGLPAAGTSIGLLRVDGVREAVVPAFRDLQAGDSEAKIRLAAGSWRAILLPQGCGEIRGDAAFVVGSDGRDEARIGVEIGGRRRLKLLGLAESELPVRVRFLEPEDLDETLSSQAFAGPLTWHRTQAEVGPWPKGANLLVHHRNRSWLGELPEDAGKDEVAVLLHAATTLRIAIANAGDHPVAAIQHSRGGAPRAMHRKLLDQGLGPTPMWFVFDVVPNGPVDVTISDAGGGVLAERHVVASGGTLDLRL